MEIHDAVAPIIKQYIANGFSARDIQLIAEYAAGGLCIAEIVRRKVLK